MTDQREQALKLVGEMTSPEVAAALANAATSREFGAFIGELALRNVFAEVWARPGLDRRSRSLVTLGILIALRAFDELEAHCLIAIRNGLTVRELEEVIYQASAYAGFPAAHAARNVALKTLLQAKIID